MEINEHEIRYSEKLADYSFGIVKFLMTSFLTSTNVYLILFTAFVMFQTSNLTEGNAPSSIKLLMFAVTAIMFLWTWAIWYLVSIAAEQMLKHMPKLNPFYTDDPYLAKAMKVFMAVGTAGGIAVTMLLFFFGLVIHML